VIRTDAEIDKLVDQYNRTGYVKVDGVQYMRVKDNPKYYWIYRGREQITDGDDLRDELIGNRDWRQSRKDKRDKGGQVIAKDIDIDKIVWITNELNDKEFIVRV
jgi:hypothetical protein